MAKKNLRRSLARSIAPIAFHNSNRVSENRLFCRRIPFNRMVRSHRARQSTGIRAAWDGQFSWYRFCSLTEQGAS
jgi:hypothetical protein